MVDLKWHGECYCRSSKSRSLMFMLNLAYWHWRMEGMFVIGIGGWKECSSLALVDGRNVRGHIFWCAIKPIADTTVIICDVCLLTLT